MATVIGVDSSTQSCKVVVCDADTGDIISAAHRGHPEGSEVDPELWWSALQDGLAEADTRESVAVSIAAQQHGMVLLNTAGEVLRPALLWNDTRSGGQANALVDRFGAADLVARTGSVPVASLTSTKLLWVRENEPELARDVAAVALPHDWLSWRLRGFGPTGSSEYGPVLSELTTDRSDASGTGYFSAVSNTYDQEIIEFCLGHVPVMPRLAGVSEVVGSTQQGWSVGPGGGDNAMAALGLDAHPGDAVMSIGTSGTVFAVTRDPAADSTGVVAGFADASGSFLPLIATLNASRAIDAVRKVVDMTWDEYSEAIHRTEPSSAGLTFLPFFDGERTPNLPDATGLLAGITRENLTRDGLARSIAEGVVSNLANGMNAISAQTEGFSRLVLIGGGAQNMGIQQVVHEIVPLPLFVPEPGEYVARGAALQASWALSGVRPGWKPPGLTRPAQPATAMTWERFSRTLNRHGYADQ